MLTQVLERSPSVWAHNHLKRDPMYGMRPDPAYPLRRNGSNAQLAEDDVLEHIIRRDGAPLVAFHALADSQRAVHLLERFPSCRVVWIWRQPEDVARSAVEKWGAHQNDLIRRLRDGETERLGWRGEGLSAALVGEVLRHFRDDLTPFDGAALFWYARNRLFETQELAFHERVRVVEYADVVSKPVEVLAPLFGWLGAAWDPAMVAHLHTSSVGRGRGLIEDEGIRALCEGLVARLRSGT